MNKVCGADTTKPAIIINPLSMQKIKSQRHSAINVTPLVSNNDGLDKMNATLLPDLEVD